MTEDLAAINLLSDRFVEAINGAPHSETTHALILMSNLEGQGLKVMRMYESELSKAPDDTDVKIGLAQHEYRLGSMYSRAIVPLFLRDSKGADELGKSMVSYAENACKSLFRSYELLPHPTTAYSLAMVFKMAGFYGTALHWIDEAIRGGAATGNSEDTTQARAQKLEMQADGTTVDPKLSRTTLFPTPNTPGLQTAPLSDIAPATKARPTLAQGTRSVFEGVSMIKWRWLFACFASYILSGVIRFHVIHLALMAFGFFSLVVALWGCGAYFLAQRRAV
jgi:hypothetical protein